MHHLKALRYDSCVRRDHTVLPATHTRTIPVFTPHAARRHRPLAGCASSDYLRCFVGRLVTQHYKSKMAADAMFDFIISANNFGEKGHVSMKLGGIIKGDMLK